MGGKPSRGTLPLQVEISPHGKLLYSLQSPTPISLPQNTPALCALSIPENITASHQQMPHTGNLTWAETESSSPRGEPGDQTPPTSPAPAIRALEHAKPAVLGPLGLPSGWSGHTHPPGSLMSSLTPVPAPCHLLREATPDHLRAPPSILASAPPAGALPSAQRKQTRQQMQRNSPSTAGLRHVSRPRSPETTQAGASCSPDRVPDKAASSVDTWKSLRASSTSASVAKGCSFILLRASAMRTMASSCLCGSNGPPG